MKILLTLTAFTLLCRIPAFAGAGFDDPVKYFNERMEPVTTKKQATYYAELVAEQDGKFTFQVKYLTGEMKMEGTYLDQAMKTAHGEFTYYYATGAIESQGQYRDGYKYGIWQRYDPDGNEKPEKVYAAGAMLKYMNAEAER